MKRGPAIAGPRKLAALILRKLLSSHKHLNGVTIVQGNRSRIFAKLASGPEQEIKAAYGLRSDARSAGYDWRARQQSGAAQGVDLNVVADRSLRRVNEYMANDFVSSFQLCVIKVGPIQRYIIQRFVSLAPK